VSDYIDKNHLKSDGSLLYLVEVWVLVLNDVAIETVAFFAAWDTISRKNKLCSAYVMNLALSKLGSSPKSFKYFSDCFSIIKEFISYLKLQLFILKAIYIYGAGPLPLKSALNAILEFAVV
jgi:hypothetical protein